MSAPWRGLVLGWALLAGPAIVASQARAQNPDVALHALEWYVHDDLVADGDGVGTHPLSFYRDLIQQAVADATVILQGDSGPEDTPCCTALDTISVQIFGDVSPSRPLLTLDNEAEFDDLNAVDATGQRAFLVQSLTFCGGPGNPVGCADTPPCGTAAGDLSLVVTMDAVDADRLAQTLAHERGHNMCLVHVGGNRCRLMQAVGGGDCLDATECGHYRAGRSGTGGTCACHAGPGGALEPEGSACVDGAVAGTCSGGVCGEAGSDASVQLIAAGGTAALQGDPPDEALSLSGAPGGWTVVGPFGSGLAPQGLAYAPGRDVLYAVAPTGGDDVLLTVDPQTGAATPVGNVAGTSNLVGLAFDPGPTEAPDDDRLLAIDGRTFATLTEIDPDDASARDLGQLSTGGGEGFNGLAYDPENRKLYASGFFGGGIFEVDASCSIPSFPVNLCDTRVVNPAGPARSVAGLAYSAATRSLHLVGTQAGPATLYDSLDATDFAAGIVTKAYTRGIDGFTVGGLAALPVPEPTLGGLAAAVLWLIGRAGFAPSRRLRSRARDRDRTRSG